MTELLHLFRFQFKKREPIIVAALTYEDAIATLKRENLYEDKDDYLESISLFSNLQILV